LALFQLIGCEVNLNGDRDNTVVRDQFDPVTFPELLLLQAIHGGADHVHSAVSVGHEERDINAERERLSLKYGANLVANLFPGALAALPLEDVSLPTLEEVQAGEAAAKAARKSVRDKPKAKPKADPITTPGGGLPDLTT
jgi:hypothetical protein